MKHKKTIFFIILIAILVIYILLSSYNNLHNKQEKINNEYSNLLIEIENKISLIKELNQLSTGNYFEIEEVKKSLIHLEDSHNINKKLYYNNILDNKINVLLIKNADNNKLSNNSTYKKLIKDIDNTNNKILNETTKYNNKVEEYNKSIKKFPNNFISIIFNFKKQKKIS